MEEEQVQGLDEKSLQELRNSFALFDKSGDGKIDKNEMGTAMRSLGLNPTDEEIQEMISECDTDADGQISLDEYIKQMSGKIGKVDEEEQKLKEAFKVFDKDGNGFINASELIAVMTASCGTDKFSKEDAQEMIKEADTNNDGVICYDEFVKVMVKKMT